MKESKMEKCADKELIKLTDEKLALLVKSGSRTAFNVLYNRFIGKSYNIAYRIVRDYEIAKDLTQDVMLKILLNIDKYDTECRFGPWYFKILNNHCLNYIKRYRIINFVPFSVFQNDPGDRDFIDLIHFDKAGDDQFSDRELLSNAIRFLSQEHKAVIRLCDIDGIPHYEAAQKIGIPLSTLRTRIFYARRHLRKHINKLNN
ncbi:RNA polymerase sigma factor [candidate division KSB1 bacterium]